MSEAQHDWLRLALSPGIGPQRFLQLIQRFGSAGAALAANRSQLAGILDGEAIDTLGSELAQQSADAALAWAQLPGCSLLTLNDDDYPCQLAAATPRHKAKSTPAPLPAGWPHRATPSSAVWLAVSTPPPTKAHCKPAAIPSP